MYDDYEVPASRKCKGFSHGRNVDIVGVTGSIPVTPTIQSLIPQGFARLLTYFPVGSTNLGETF
jgi:hypothetical protein